ncbi:hypothetical protein [Flectobacillus roseus]|uniref:Uncharacterized protein n=1 Tax=Flectobacillus roseus TaxID=502259 RepID=A0ABT6Y7V7_9BACT|nr:hypothetical protein [Flectobacillus roseus]MDI9859643.1 hypothetical protein [Flectobacillus roseus]
MNPKKIKVKLTSLLINLENFRFETVDNQKDAIKQMVEDQKEKLFNLAKSILEEGFNPHEGIIVSKRIPSSNSEVLIDQNEKNTLLSSKKYIVIEGNRRITSLKLFVNPTLLKDSKNPMLQKKFQDLHDDYFKNRSKYTFDIESSVECLYYENPNDALKWIKTKHIGQYDGVGTVSWTASQIDRFEEMTGGRASKSLQVVSFLRNLDSVSPEFKLKLNLLKVTTLDRLLADPDVRIFLGLELESGRLYSKYSLTEVQKGLVGVISDLLSPDFTVKKVYTKELRADYLDNFNPINIPNFSTFQDTSKWYLDTPDEYLKLEKTKTDEFDTQQGIGQSLSLDSLESPSSESLNSTVGIDSNLVANSNKVETVVQHPKSTSRKFVIPKSFKVTINEPKVNDIFLELKDLDITKFQNVASISLRVFIELSLDCYLEKNNLIPNNGSAAKSGLTLQKKVMDVASHLENTKKADPAICKGIKISCKDPNNLIGIDTLHAYLHNHRFASTTENLIITWNNIQDFMFRVWQ